MYDCPTPYPEPHILGEFPMSCRRCHVYINIEDEEMA